MPPLLLLLKIYVPIRLQDSAQMLAIGRHHAAACLSAATRSMSTNDVVVSEMISFARSSYKVRQMNAMPGVFGTLAVGFMLVSCATHLAVVGSANAAAKRPL
jgi:hypothetical protein